MGEIVECIALLELRTGGAPVGKQRTQRDAGRAVLLDEHGFAGAARQRLESECTGTRKQIEAAAAGDTTLQPVEQGLAHAVGRRAHVGVRKAPASAAPLAGNDA